MSVYIEIHNEHQKSEQLKIQPTIQYPGTVRPQGDHLDPTTPQMQSHCLTKNLKN